jgi:3-oxoacyl-[acyl-carrier protein] reductase
MRKLSASVPEADSSLSGGGVEEQHVVHETPHHAEHESDGHLVIKLVENLGFGTANFRRPRGNPMGDMVADRVAIVTGAGQGIGRATARTLAAEGARVVVADLDAGRVKGVIDEIGAGGGGAVDFVADLTEPGAPDAMVAKAIEAFGQLDIVVNNAGYNWDGLLHTMTDEQFQSQLDIHVVVPFRILRGPAKAEAAQGIERFRKVVNVTSVAAVFGQPGAGNYSAGKAALIGLTRTLANEWGPLKINVNAVAFGGISTRLSAPAQESGRIVVAGHEIQVGLAAPTARAYGMDAGHEWSDDEIYAPRPFSVVPLGRTGTVQEAANAVLYLCSPLSNYVHGHVHVVSGGFGYGVS